MDTFLRIAIFGGGSLMFWALGEITWSEAFRDSGSSLLTLGFANINGLPQTIFTFSEAAPGLLLVALKLNPQQRFHFSYHAALAFISIPIFHFFLHIDPNAGQTSFFL